MLQYPLWFAKGSGWFYVWKLERDIAKQNATNQKHKMRNDILQAEVIDLKTRQTAIEEHARADLGMIKDDEVFFQVMQ